MTSATPTDRPIARTVRGRSLVLSVAFAALLDRGLRLLEQQFDVELVLHARHSGHDTEHFVLELVLHRRRRGQVGCEPGSQS